ncbi:phage N-6-adenine-methyltransferase [Christensenellaceae bacterium 44-20]
MNKALFSSNSQEWCTPQWLFDSLDEEFHFALDAAANDSNKKCPLYYTVEMDGLQQDWSSAGGAVFCNPPYGRELKKWVQKGYEEAQKGVKVVMLIPARTDTSYFHEYIYGKAEIRFLKGRLKFTDNAGKEYSSAPFPSMVVIFGGTNEKQQRKRTFNWFGRALQKRA